MSKIRLVAVAVTVVAIVGAPLAVQAQDEEASTSFVYGTYFECDVNNEWLADAIVDQLLAPIYDAAVEDGTLTAWGWLTHDAGGKWRRALYHVSPTIEGMFESSKMLNEKADEANAQAAAKFGEICSAHDDYIWQAGTGSGGAGSVDVATTPSKAGVSQYLVCDVSKEARADELVATFASVYDAQVEAGHLSAWGWLHHVIGGEYRRLLNMRGADHPTVLAAWGAIISDLSTNHAEALEEFGQICNSHQDYLWNVR